MDKLIGKMKSQNYDLRFRKLLANAPDGFQAIQFRHADVHHDNVRLVLFGERNRFAAISRLSAHFPPGLGSKQLLQAAPNDVMIVRDQDTQTHESSFLSGKAT